MNLLNYKEKILICLEAPNESLRVTASKLLGYISIDIWELLDLQTMLRIL